MLKIKNLTKRYRAGDLALNDVDLHVKPGEVIALIGPSGAGKSSLIRCVNRLVEPTSGSIRVRDTEITGLPPRRLRSERRRIGMIFQEYALVERLSVMENVLSGRLGYTGFWASALRRYPAADISRALELLERVGLEEHIDKRADALSGGQRQRVGIVRALCLLVIVTSRSVHSLVWALLLVFVFGPGSFAGVLAITLRAIGFIAKLLYEAIEEVSRSSIEAIEATGASPAQRILYGITPQVLPNFAGIVLFRWDINIRESTFLGLVGAGGVGMLLDANVNALNFPRVAIILLAILVMVIAAEWLSAQIRSRIR